MSAWCEQVRGASRRQYTYEMVTWLHLGKNEDLDISKGLYLQTGYLTSFLRSGRYVVAMVRQMKVGVGWKDESRKTRHYGGSEWKALPMHRPINKQMQLRLFLTTFAMLGELPFSLALGRSQYQPLNHRLRHSNSSSNNKWPHPSLHVESLIQAFWSCTPWPRPHDGVITSQPSTTKPLPQSLHLPSH